MVGWIPKYILYLYLDSTPELLTDIFHQAAMGDFWKRKDEWIPSWPPTVEERALVMYVSDSSRPVSDADRHMPQ
jgi:hypothetical protein